jgi:hypothetical protein
VGRPESLVSKVVLDNIQIPAPIGLTLRNANGLRLKNVKIVAEEGNPFLVENAQVEGLEAAKNKPQTRGTQDRNSVTDAAVG